MQRQRTILGAIIGAAMLFAVTPVFGEPTIQTGTEGADTQTFTGTAGDDVILQLGLGGNDTQDASGLEGNDYIYQDGGAGDNSITASGGAGDDQIFQFGGDGKNGMAAFGDEGDDFITLAGGAGNDTITAVGGAGNDQIIVDGGAGNDTITANGGDGNDFIRVEGGAGNDTVTYNVSAGDDTASLDGGAGTNQLVVNKNGQSYTLRDGNGAIIRQDGSGGTNITATNFRDIRYDGGAGLIVAVSGNGTGTITSSPAGVNCGSTCRASYTKNTKVTLTPRPDKGSSFTSWSGGCKGTGACSVTMKADTTVGAGFSGVPCTYAPSPKTKSVTCKGGVVSIAITAKGSTYCPAPDVSADSEWITISSNTFSKTKGTVILTIPLYESSVARSGTVTIGEEAFILTQKGRDCAMSLSANSSPNFDSGEHSDVFTVKAVPADCAWTAAADKKSTWVTVTSGSPGTGTADVGYTVSANSDHKAARSGKIIITMGKKTKTFAVKQSK